MSTWGHRARLGDRRLTRATMDSTNRGSTVSRAMFFGPGGAPPTGGVTATLSAVLVAMTLSASATPAVAATSDRTLPGLSLASSSTVAVAAGAAPMLPGFGLTSSGAVAPLAQLSGLLSLSLTASASIAGVEPVTASLVATFPAITLYARAFAEVHTATRPPRRVATHIRARSLRVRRVR